MPLYAYSQGEVPDCLLHEPEELGWIGLDGGVREGLLLAGNGAVAVWLPGSRDNPSKRPESDFVRYRTG